MSNHRYQRQYLVNKQYQLTQVGVAIAANLLVILLMAALMSWFYLLYLNQGVAANHNRLFPVYIAVAALLVVFFSTIWSLSRSRMVAGMMRKLNIVLRDAASGKLPDRPLIFRKGDSFKWLAVPLNNCFLRLQQQQSLLNSTVNALEALKDKINTRQISGEELAAGVDAILTGLVAAEKSSKGE
jgi:hypothetical protein